MPGRFTTQKQTLEESGKYYFRYNFTFRNSIELVSKTFAIGSKNIFREANDFVKK
jgi:hypothetical protein